MSFVGYLHVFEVLLSLFVVKCQYNVGIFYLGHQVGNGTAHNIVKVIEGEDLILDCVSYSNNASIAWFRNNILLTLNNKLHLKRITLEEAGNYKCIDSYEKYLENVSFFAQDSILVKVLYPPSKPVIEIPSFTLSGEELELTCSVKSDPEPFYQWRKKIETGPLLSRNKTFRFIVPADSIRFFCNVHSLMLPTLSELRKVYVSSSVYLKIHTKAEITHLYPRTYAYYDEGNNLVLKCDGRGTPTPNVWWTKIGDKFFNVTGLRYYRFNVVKSDEGEYVCNFANTVTAANGSQYYIHRTATVHVFVQEINTNDQSPNLSCDTCLSTCLANSDFKLTTSLLHGSSSMPTLATTTTPNIIDHINSTGNCTKQKEEDMIHQVDLESNSNSKQLIFIITFVTGGIMITVILFIIICLYWTKRIPNFCNKMSRHSNHIEHNSPTNQTTGASSAYVTNVRISDSDYTDLTTYDQISSTSSTRRFGEERENNVDDLNDTESMSTQTSLVTYLEPIADHQ